MFMHVCTQNSETRQYPKLQTKLNPFTDAATSTSTYVRDEQRNMVGSFTARRSKPELVAPARSTPRETKPLSDLDDDSDLRYLQPGLEFFRPVDGHHRRADNDANPAKAIKAALAEALVYYYPIAGRLRELHKGKLAVDCTGEGVVFVEAEAGVRLEDLGQPPLPPYPYADEFLCDVGDDGDVVGMPLFFMQVVAI
ncbi:hypothetical protein E2562_034965 [Oryza meyeriana var. granulata]|uniref:Uncharacterized protein n=1 Tax=Oryza meyeriana var. granulata TaxID=110450 RepID=A0A6G1BQE1_9ORYZ|nr:hypothetical protein E2562_034965 [Oryza meyeriana var. granulata]